MNAARRERLAKAVQQIEELIAEEEQAFENLPDSFQDGTQGDQLQQNVESLTTAKDELEPLLF